MSSHRDFDFLIGRWQVHNRKLNQRLVQCTDWQEFDAELTVRPALNGFANVDEFVVTGSDFKGMTLRLFNPETRQWSLYWADSNRVSLDKPLVGSFENGIGSFYCDGEWQGTPVRIRFLWTGIRSDSACWEQAFSVDQGSSWEVNWLMQFSRLR